MCALHCSQLLQRQHYNGLAVADHRCPCPAGVPVGSSAQTSTAPLDMSPAVDPAETAINEPAQPVTVSAFARLAAEPPLSRSVSPVLSDDARTGSSAGLMSPLGRSTSSAAQRLQDQQAGAAAHARGQHDAYQQKELQQACSGGVPSVREAILGLQRRFGSLDLTMVPQPGQTSHAAGGGAGLKHSRAVRSTQQEVVQRAASVPAEPADALSLQLHKDGEQREMRLPSLRHATTAMFGDAIVSTHVTCGIIFRLVHLMHHLREQPAGSNLSTSVMTFAGSVQPQWRCHRRQLRSSTRR